MKSCARQIIGATAGPGPGIPSRPPLLAGPAPGAAQSLSCARGVTNIMQTLCRHYADIMQKLCENYAEIMRILCENYANICRNYAQIMLKLCGNYAKIMQTLCVLCVLCNIRTDMQIMRILCEHYAKIMRKLCGNYVDHA